MVWKAEKLGKYINNHANAVLFKRGLGQGLGAYVRSVLLGTNRLEVVPLATSVLRKW